jgi:hypothetical protein
MQPKRAGNNAQAQVRQGARATLTWSQVRGFRLLRHYLLERAPTTALISVVGVMAGAQAQVLSAAQISLWFASMDGDSWSNERTRRR